MISVVLCRFYKSIASVSPSGDGHSLFCSVYPAFSLFPVESWMCGNLLAFSLCYNVFGSNIKYCLMWLWRRGEGGFGHMRTVGRGVKDLADVRKLVLFSIVSACFADTLSVDDAY